MLQSQYVAWLEALPSNLQDSATAEALQAICELDLADLQAIEPPRDWQRLTPSHGVSRAPVREDAAAVIARLLWLCGRRHGELVRAPVPRQQRMQFVALGAA